MSSDLVAPAKTSTEVAETVAQVLGACASIAAERVDSNAAFELAGLRLRWTKDAREALETERDSVVRPLVEAVERVRSWFAPALQSLESADRRLREQLAAYQRQVREHNTAALAGGAPMLEPPSASAVTMVATIEVEIVDAAQVPREYLVPDVARIKAEARAGRLASLPGVRIERVETPRLKGRK